MTCTNLKEKGGRLKHRLADEQRERPHDEHLSAIAGQSRRRAATRRLAELRVLYRVAREALGDEAQRIRRLLHEAKGTVPEGHRWSPSV